MNRYPSAVAPADWHSQIDYDSWNDPFTPDDGIAIHNGGAGNYYAGRVEPPSPEAEMAQLRVWERLHLGKGWRGLAYGWALGQSGTIYRARAWNRYGAHLGDVDGDGIANNDEIIPVLWIGDGLNQHPTPQAIAGFEKFRLWLEQESGHGLWLYGHKEVQSNPTSCPGPNWMPYIEANRTSTPTPEPPPAIRWPHRLELGDRQKAVVSLRGLLYTLGYGGKHTMRLSRFTPELESRVKAWQSDAGLEADGTIEHLDRVVLGGLTEEALA